MPPENDVTVPEGIKRLEITDTVSGRAWGDVDKSRIWQILSAALEAGIGGAVSATREMYAVVQADIDKDLTRADTWGPHHEITRDGNLTLNRGGLIAATAALAGARAEPDLTDDEFAAARSHLRRHYNEIEDLQLPEVLGGEGEMAGGPAVGELAVDVAMDKVPLSAEGKKAAEKLTEGDENPCWVAVEVYEGEGSHGYYTESAIKAVVDQVNAKEPMGFLGHQKAENVSHEFPEPATHWLAAEMTKKGERAVAKLYGLIDQAHENLRRWVRARRIKEVSIFGNPTYERGTRNVKDYNLLSIDWAPRDRAGMETRLLWASEMAGGLDGSLEAYQEEMERAVGKRFAAGEDSYAFVRRTYPDEKYVIVTVGEHGRDAVMYKVSYAVEDDEVILGDAVEVEEHREYVETEQPETQEAGGEMADEKRTWQEVLADVRAAVAKDEVDTKEVLAELGITGEQALETLGDDRLKQLKNASTLCKGLLDALALDQDMEADKAVALAGEMQKVWGKLGLADREEPLQYAGELLKTSQAEHQSKQDKIIEKVVGEQVTGEQAQKLIKRLLTVEEGADEETVRGEVKALLEDEEIKAMLSRLHTDDPAPRGGSEEKGKGEFKSGKMRKVRL